METTISVAENSLNLSLLKFKHFIKQNGILFDEIMIFARLLSRGTTDGDLLDETVISIHFLEIMQAKRLNT